MTQDEVGKHPLICGVLKMIKINQDQRLDVSDLFMLLYNSTFGKCIVMGFSRV